MQGYQLPGGELLPKEVNTSTAPRFCIETYWAQKNGRQQQIQHQLLIEDWEAERDGLIAMGPPPSSWYGHSTMDVYQQQMQSHGLHENLITGMHNELTILRRKVDSIERPPARKSVILMGGPVRCQTPSMGQQLPKTGTPAVYTMDKVVSLINVLQGQNILTRTGVTLRSEEPDNGQGFQRVRGRHLRAPETRVQTECRRM